jgi:hypothetical protein
MPRFEAAIDLAVSLSKVGKHLRRARRVALDAQ